MPVNPYLDNRLPQEDLDLIQQLTDECIQFVGFDVHYIPRKWVTSDRVMGEILSSRFENYYTVEMALEERGGWARNNVGLSKFGITFTGDAHKLSVSRRRFAEAVPSAELKQAGKPSEGDLVYIPHVQQLMEIVDVLTQDPFTSGGTEFVFHISVLPFKWSNERVERKNFDIREKDGLSVMDELVRRWDTTEKKAPSGDTVCWSSDSLDVTVDNDQVGVDRVLTADRDFETVDADNRHVDDDFDQMLSRAVTALNDRVPNNLNSAIDRDAKTFVTDEPDFGYR